MTKSFYDVIEIVGKLHEHIAKMVNLLPELPKDAQVDFREAIRLGRIAVETGERCTDAAIDDDDEAYKFARNEAMNAAKMYDEYQQILSTKYKR